MAEPARLPLGPMALGHPKISILAWETAEKHRRNSSLRALLNKLTGPHAFPLSCNSQWRITFLLNQSELAGVDTEQD